MAECGSRELFPSSSRRGRGDVGDDCERASHRFAQCGGTGQGKVRAHRNTGSEAQVREETDGQNVQGRGNPAEALSHVPAFLDEGDIRDGQ